MMKIQLRQWYRLRGKVIDNPERKSTFASSEYRDMPDQVPEKPGQTSTLGFRAES
jgi:hypothetical protein